MSRTSERDAPPVAIVEMKLGPSLPTLRIGDGPRQLVYLPGLSVNPGRTMILAELDAWLHEPADDLAGRIACPTLVIGTERDPVFPPAATRALAARLRDGQLVIVDKLAHNVPPRAMADVISPFLG